MFIMMEEISPLELFELVSFFVRLDQTVYIGRMFPLLVRFDEHRIDMPSGMKDLPAYYFLSLIFCFLFFRDSLAILYLSTLYIVIWKIARNLHPI